MAAVTRTRARPAWLLGCMILASTRQVHAQAPTEYQIKAAFLVNFARFVDWPAAAFADSSAPFVVGILGTDPFGPVLDRAVRDQSIGGRGIRLERLRDPVAARACHILFVGSSETDNLHAVFAALASFPVLLVADVPDFARRGGHIQFVVRSNKVRFEINSESARRDGLKIGSKLLRLAAAVYGGEP